MYFKKVEELFDGRMKSTLFFKLLQLVPQLRSALVRIFDAINNVRAFINIHLLSSVSKKQLHERPDAWLHHRLHSILEQRQQTPTSRVDLLQLMLQVITDEQINVRVRRVYILNTFLFQDEMQNGSKANYRLTREEIISNIFIFMIAGYETTSTTLACATYELARNPEVLEKLQAEIDELPLATDDTIDEEIKKYPNYDIVAQMPYMDMFVSEVLRMYPIANQAVQRRAFEDTIVQGIKIDKGNYVVSYKETLHMSFIFYRHLSVCRCLFHPLRSKTLGS